MTINASQLLQDAKLAVREKNVDKAWQLLHEYIIERPDDVDAWLMLGGLSKPENRLAYIQRAADLAPDDPRVGKALIWARGQTQAVEEREPVDEGPTSPVQIEPASHGSVETQSFEPIAHEPESGEPEVVESSPDETVAATPEPGPTFVPIEPPEEYNSPEWYGAEANASQEKGDEPKKKPFKWLQTLFTVLFLVVIFFLLGTGIYAMITGTEPNVFGYQMMMVTSGSMEPTFMTGSIIIVNTNEGQDYQIGDVAMFWTPEDPDRNITHRIISISEQDGRQYYQTQGDYNNAPDQELITIGQIRGKYANFTIPYLGYFFSFIKSRDGILLLAVLLGLYLVITQAFRIRKLMREDAEELESEAEVEEA
ncbi:signal peptidase I [bacterium]|nr:signal peptidase I [bacterium]